MPEIEEIKGPTIVPKSEAQAKAEEIKAERALPTKPGDRVDFISLKRWLEILDDSQLARLNIYVYRQDPIINMQSVDPEADNNIDIFYDINKQSVGDISEDYFINTHGGGRYKLVIKDLDKPKTQKGGFFEANLYVSMTQYPPKIKDMRVVDWSNPRNKGYMTWCKSNKLIDDNGMPTIERTKEAPTGPVVDNTVPLMKMFMEFTSKMDEKQQEKVKVALAGNDGIGKGISEILLERMKQDDPTKLVTIISTLMTAMKSNEPKPIPQADPLTSILPFMQMMQESNNRTFTVMMTMMDKMNSGGGKEVDEIERMKSLMEIAKMMKGGTAAPERSVTEQIIEAATSILPQGLALVNNIMAANAASKGVQMSAPPIVGQKNQTQVAQEAQVAAQQTAVTPQAGLPQPMTLTEKQNNIRQFAPMIVANLGKDGWEIAAQMANVFPQGDHMIAAIIKDGEEDLLTTIKSVPEVWGQIENTFGEAHTKKWLHEFVHYREIIAKMEEEDRLEDEAEGNG